MKKALVIGAGLTGCVISRLLVEKYKSVEVDVFEKNNTIGGLCETSTVSGNVFQVHGPHQFHTKYQYVIDFIKKFGIWDNYVHYKGAYFEEEDRYVPLPLSFDTINTFKCKDIVLEQLSSLPNMHRTDTFEHATKDIVGEYIYDHFFKGYSEKLWREPLNKLTGEWVSKRIKISNINKESYFDSKETQLMPRGGFNCFFENLLDDKRIKVYLNSLFEGNVFNANYDYVFSSMPIDELFDFKFGKLKYVGIRNEIRIEKEWNFPWANINFSSKNIDHIRRTNYNVIYKQNKGDKIIGYEYPCENSKMYPVKTEKYQAMFEQYKAESHKFRTIKSVGRLGQFKYINMDECISDCFKLIGNLN